LNLSDRDPYSATTFKPWIRLGEALAAQQIEEDLRMTPPHVGVVLAFGRLLGEISAPIDHLLGRARLMPSCSRPPAMRSAAPASSAKCIISVDVPASQRECEWAISTAEAAKRRRGYKDRCRVMRSRSCCAAKTRKIVPVGFPQLSALDLHQWLCLDSLGYTTRKTMIAGRKMHRRKMHRLCALCF
jgi:hypothetical protein